MNNEELKEIRGGDKANEDHFPPEVTAKLKKSIESYRNGGKVYTLEEMKERHQRRFLDN